MNRQLYDDLAGLMKERLTNVFADVLGLADSPRMQMNLAVSAAAYTAHCFAALSAEAMLSDEYFDKAVSFVLEDMKRGRTANLKQRALQ